MEVFGQVVGNQDIDDVWGFGIHHTKHLLIC
jgi:hypothetical protein